MLEYLYHVYKIFCRADVNVQKIVSLDYASQREHNKVTTAAMIKRLQEREGDTGSTVVQSEWHTLQYVCSESTHGAAALYIKL